MTNVIYVGTCPVTEALLAKLQHGEVPPDVISDRENPFYGHEVFRYTGARGVGDAVRISCVLCTTHNDFWVRNHGIPIQSEYEAYMRKRHANPLPVQHPDKPAKLSPHICRGYGSEYSYYDGNRCLMCRPVSMREYEARSKTLESNNV